MQRLRLAYWVRLPSSYFHRFVFLHHLPASRACLLFSPSLGLFNFFPFQSGTTIVNRASNIILIFLIHPHCPNHHNNIRNQQVAEHRITHGKYVLRSIYKVRNFPHSLLFTDLLPHARRLPHPPVLYFFLTPSTIARLNLSVGKAVLLAREGQRRLFWSFSWTKPFSPRGKSSWSSLPRRFFFSNPPLAFLSLTFISFVFCSIPCLP